MPPKNKQQNSLAGTKRKKVPSAASAAKDGGKENVLLREILDLGGTKEDLELLADIDSDEEFDDTKVPSSSNSELNEEAKLKKELESYLDTLGYDPTSLPEDEIEHEEDLSSATDEEVDRTEIETTRQETKVRTTDKLLVQPTPFWYNVELAPVLGSKKGLTDEAIDSKLAGAMELLQKETATHDANPALSTGDRAFLSTLLRSGTLNDKVSALTLVIQESPLHAKKTMETMMGLARKKGRREAVMAAASLKDLFVGSLLPERKLKYFRDQPLGGSNVTAKHLLLWVFEDFLKKFYFEFIRVMETLSHDPLLHVKQSMIQFIYDLLVAKPEQEQNLLRLLVNKLGDAEKKIGSKSSHLIQQLLVAHPNMKMVVVRETEQLLQRPNMGARAQYYTVVALNQTILTNRDHEVAAKLIDVYFVLFKQLLESSSAQARGKNIVPKKKKKARWAKGKNAGKGKKAGPKPATEELASTEDGVDSKMVAAILTGVNRAFPFAKIQDSVYDAHMDVLFRVTHTGTFNISVQALLLIFHVSSSKQAVSDRFYRTLYDSLFDTRLINSSKQAIYLNLLFKALKVDPVSSRVKAFVKRIIQVAGMHQPPFICGTFYMISEIIALSPSIRAMINQPEDNDDDDEHFVDVDREEEEETEAKAPEAKSQPSTAKKPEPTSEYDATKREPQFAKAERTCLWELSPFTSHFHPTVSLYARTMLSGDRITGSPQLHLHTLSHFLDRFVYRNAKKAAVSRGGSIMQPSGKATNLKTAGDEVTDSQQVVWRKGAARSNTATGQMAAVNTEAWIRQKMEDVPVDEQFFHKYFNQKQQKESVITKKKKKNVEDEENAFGGEEDEDEDEVWNAMMKSGGVPNAGESEDDDDEDLQALLDDDDDDDEEENDEEEDEEEGEGNSDEDSEGDLDGFGMEDEDDLIPSEEEGEGLADDAEEDNRPKKRKRTVLPTFASAEEYAHILDQD